MAKKNDGKKPKRAGFFDFNRDGKVSLGEHWIAYQIFKDCMRQEDQRDDFLSDDFFSSPASDPYAWRCHCRDGSEYGVDPEDYETEQAYEDALERYAWRLECEDGTEYGIDPMDFETEEAYNEALAEEKYAWRESCEDGSEYGVDPEDYETEEEYEYALEDAKCGWRNEVFALGWQYGVDPQKYETREEFEQALEAERSSAPSPEEDAAEEAADEDEIRPEDYPNQRTYQAAYNRDGIRRGYVICMSASIKEQELARCEFILGADSPLAARYLTVDGEFLCAQAVKEHFPGLPVQVQPEDEACNTPLGKLIRSLARHDPALALEIWLWCIQQFYPYREYSNEQDYLLEEMLDQLDDLPEEFLTRLADRLAQREELRKLVASGSDSSGEAMRTLCALELRRGHGPAAQALLRDFLAGERVTGAQICELAEGLLWDCREEDGLEQMEAFQTYLLPLLAGVKKSVVQRRIKAWRRKAAQYIDEMERTCEKYAYTRRYAWRADCQDGSEYRIDPLDYETREEYDAAILEARYGWREYYADTKEELGLDPQDYETEAEFSRVVQEAQERRWAQEAGERRRRREEELARRRQEREEQRAKARQAVQADPLAAEDQTVYTFCGVRFHDADAGPVYHYRTEETDIHVGDQVIVPVGEENREVTARVVSVGQYLRGTAPYPVERAKFILGRTDT